VLLAEYFFSTGRKNVLPSKSGSSRRRGGSVHEGGGGGGDRLNYKIKKIYIYFENLLYYNLFADICMLPFMKRKYFLSLCNSDGN